MAGANGGNTSPLISNINQPNENHTYTYDDAGNILSVKRGSITTTYAYDGIGQLTRVNDPNDTAGGSSGTTWVYEYDRGGNILAKKCYAYTTGALGTCLQAIPYAYGDSVWKDKVTSFNGITFSYDAIGNLTSDGSFTYGWSAGRLLTSMTNANTAITYDYDQSGMRVRKNVNGVATNYTYNGKMLAHMTKGLGSMRFFCDAQGRPAMVNFSGSRFHYIHDLRGESPVSLTAMAARRKNTITTRGAGSYPQATKLVDMDC